MLGYLADLVFQLRLLSEEQERSEAEIWSCEKQRGDLLANNSFYRSPTTKKYSCFYVVTRVLKTGIGRGEEDGLFLLWGGSIGVFARSGGLFAAREQLSSRSQRNLAKFWSRRPLAQRWAQIPVKSCMATTPRNAS
jgi:hypothetical protein